MFDELDSTSARSLAAGNRAPRHASLAPASERPGLVKVPTGIDGLDDVLLGGVPAGRPTLICGSAGCGKTLMAMEFLVRGATEYGEPGAYVSFEETERELAENVRSLGFDVAELERANMLAFDH